jgi:hypothetical protein
MDNTFVECGLVVCARAVVQWAGGSRWERAQSWHMDVNADLANYATHGTRVELPLCRRMQPSRMNPSLKDKNLQTVSFPSSLSQTSRVASARRLAKNCRFLSFFESGISCWISTSSSNHTWPDSSGMYPTLPQLIKSAALTL